MKETFYFSHDYGARNDEKILKLIQKEGLEGYGIYWCLIEKLYEADGFLDEDYESIAFDLRTDCERITRVIKDYKLFVVASKKIHSKSCLARLKKRKGISEQNRQSAILRWNKVKERDANALPTQSKRNASKVKESKGKESKDLQLSVADNINPLMELFYTINPGLNFGNKTQRKAISWLVDKTGEEKARRTIEYAISVQGEKYSPVITTPLQLKNKLGDLKIYFEKQKDNSSKIRSL